MRRRTAIVLGLAAVAALVPLSRDVDSLRVGSKKFTESVVLGELVSQLAEDAGTPMLHSAELGGTRILFEALRAGEIDVYPEYTGTILEELLADRIARPQDGQSQDAQQQVATMRAALAELGIAMSRPLGFNNTYAIGVLAKRAEELGLERVSDLVRYPDLSFGVSNEFLDRADGWPALKEAYGLPHREVAGMDHDVAYRQLEAGSIQAMDVYTTDADLLAFDIRCLEDDRAHFPRYDAVLLYRQELARTHPHVVASINRLEGALSEVEIMDLNAQARLEKTPERAVAAAFLADRFGVQTRVAAASLGARLWQRTREHLQLFRLSYLLAVLVGVPLGILAARMRRTGQVVLGAVSIVQTIPALALLVLLIQPTAALGWTSIGPGSAAAVIALFLYSLLPIVRNTCEGLRGVPLELRETALALGLSDRARLLRVELPLASRTILAGLKTAAILNVGFATLGALIGAGGYGQPILTGIRLNDMALILEGALPAAVLAVVVQGLFELVDRLLVPAGLRLEPDAVTATWWLR